MLCGVGLALLRFFGALLRCGDRLDAALLCGPIRAPHEVDNEPSEEQGNEHLPRQGSERPEQQCAQRV
jgi:hypothetical protein